MKITFLVLLALLFTTTTVNAAHMSIAPGTSKARFLRVNKLPLCGPPGCCDRGTCATERGGCGGSNPGGCCACSSK